MAAVGDRLLTIEGREYMVKSAGNAMHAVHDKAEAERNLVKALIEAAARYNKVADGYKWQGSTGAELERCYRDKANDALAKAARVGSGKQVLS